MGRILVMENLSLDGVMQAPGRRTRTRVTGSTRAVGSSSTTTRSRRFLGRTWVPSGGAAVRPTDVRGLAGFWPKQADGNPFTAALDAAADCRPTTLAEPPPW
jgi:hypothetical protein